MFVKHPMELRFLHSFEAALFGRMPDGAAVSLFTLESEVGLRVSITDYGGAITSLLAPDRNGVLADVVLGYDSLEKYLTGKSYFGAIIGRFANRIGQARFEVAGVSYLLARNDGLNHLHGGPIGFDRRLWKAKATEFSLCLTHTSPDGDQGYPGTVHAEVTYSFEDNRTLRVDYSLETDKTTIVNLTNHSYFNLAGHSAGTILDHQLMLKADAFTPVTAELIPTGELRDVNGTPFDFREERAIGATIASDDEQLRLAGGYDHNFVLHRNQELHLAATVHEPGSGRTLEVITTEPGLQFYSGNFLDGSDLGKEGFAYEKHGGFCLETQHFPDSPNHSNFPSSVLGPGELYHSTTLYRFGAR